MAMSRRPDSRGNPRALLEGPRGGTLSRRLAVDRCEKIPLLRLTA